MLARASYVDRTQNILKFGGKIWYVSKDYGSDDYDGHDPDRPFETIGKAISEMAVGDAVVIRAGIYTETGLDLSKNYTELWFELGAQLDPASGTALTISGNYCRVTCREGALKITPATNQTGVIVSGNFCYLDEVRVACFNTDEATSADVGFDVTGNGADLRRCRCSSPDVAAFKIQGDKVKLDNCCTGGGEAGSPYSSIGFWLTNSCNKIRVRHCASQGHGTAGFQVDSGCDDIILYYCSSGGGDGRWTDADDVAVWTGFKYDAVIHTDMTFNGDGASAKNLFKVTGVVEIQYIYGVVESALNADVGNIYLDLWDGTNTVDITDSAGVDASSLGVGSLIVKAADATVAATLADSSQCRVIENTDWKETKANFIVTQKESTNTHIRIAYAGTATDGTIHWYCHWLPLSDDGFLEAA